MLVPSTSLPTTGELESQAPVDSDSSSSDASVAPHPPPPRRIVGGAMPAITALRKNQMSPSPPPPQSLHGQAVNPRGGRYRQRTQPAADPALSAALPLAASPRRPLVPPLFSSQGHSGELLMPPRTGALRPLASDSDSVPLVAPRPTTWAPADNAVRRRASETLGPSVGSEALDQHFASSQHPGNHTLRRASESNPLPLPAQPLPPPQVRKVSAWTAAEGAQFSSDDGGVREPIGPHNTASANELFGVSPVARPGTAHADSSSRGWSTARDSPLGPVRVSADREGSSTARPPNIPPTVPQLPLAATMASTAAFEVGPQGAAALGRVRGWSTAREPAADAVAAADLKTPPADAAWPTSRFHQEQREPPPLRRHHQEQLPTLSVDDTYNTSPTDAQPIQAAQGGRASGRASAHRAAPALPLTLSPHRPTSVRTSPPRRQLSPGPTRPLPVLGALPDPSRPASAPRTRYLAEHDD